MPITIKAERVNGKIVRIIGEGNEDGDEFSEILEIIRELHESMHEAKKLGETVQVEISIVPLV